MKARWIAALLMTLALVASSFAVAYAGGMGAPVPISLFDCYVIHNGAEHLGPDAHEPVDGQLT